MGVYSNVNVKELHRLLSCRAFVSAALHCVRWAKLYASDGVYDELSYAEEVLGSILSKLERAIGVLVFGRTNPRPDPSVTELIRREVLGGEGG